MNDTLKRLRDAVTSRGREVEVAPDGSVRARDEDKRHITGERTIYLVPQLMTDLTRVGKEG
jgi:hypothetical protein